MTVKWSIFMLVLSVELAPHFLIGTSVFFLVEQLQGMGDHEADVLLGPQSPQECSKLWLSPGLQQNGLWGRVRAARTSCVSSSVLLWHVSAEISTSRDSASTHDISKVHG